MYYVRHGSIPQQRHTQHRAPDGIYAAGKALPIASARLQFPGVDVRRPVGKDDEAVSVTVPLRAGPLRLQASFLDAEEKTLCGAYYAYVRRR